MAVSESVLNAVNLFSSTSVFNANKGSVGATDLNFIKQTTAELATEGGGIIAQSLGTNGYVKFANGLILQWGKSSSSGSATTTVTLPISMASAIYAVAISQAAARDTWSTWSSIVSNTQIKLTNNYGPGSWWLVTGKQQWGYRNDSSNNGQNTLICNLPIAMSNTNYIVARDTHTASTSGTTVFRNSFGTMSKTTTSFTYRYHSSDTGYTMHWFACGY